MCTLLNMNTPLTQRIIQYLEVQQDLVFFYIFGSVLTSEKFRDVDIAVYFRNDTFDLLRIGELISEIEAITESKTDVVVLNHLYSKNPAFAHEIVSTGQLGYVIGASEADDKSTWVTFKVNCIKYFEDTRYLRKLSREALINRVESGDLGKRNYAH
jgi:predicted nucleotidyltransferase